MLAFLVIQEGNQAGISSGSDGGYSSSPGEGILSAAKYENASNPSSVAPPTKAFSCHAGGSKSSSSGSRKSSNSESP